MIQPTAPISIPAQTGDGLWITSLSIVAPSTSGNVRCMATVAPFSSTDGTIFKTMQKTVVINDLLGQAQTNPIIGAAVSGIYAAVQNQITGAGLF